MSNLSGGVGSVPYKRELSQLGMAPGASGSVNALRLQEQLTLGGFLSLTLPGTYRLTTACSFVSDTTLELGPGVILDSSSMSVPCITATNKSNIRITGDGKIVCSAASVPSFTGCTNVAVDITIVDTNGVVLPITLNVSSPLVLASKSLLTTAPYVSRYRVTGTNAPLIKNKYCGYLNKESRFTRESNVATVLDTGHTFSVGDQVYIRNLTDATFNGLQTVTSIVADTSWTYANTGSNYSSGSATKYGYIIPVRRTIALASFTANTDFPSNAATGYTYVADVNTDVRVGFLIWIAGPGIVEVVRVDSTGFTYAGAVPTDSTVALSYDYDITIDGGIFDGNRTGQTGLNSDMHTNTMMFGCVNNLRLINVRSGSSAIRAINAFNCQNVSMEGCETFDCLVGAQFEGGGKRHRIYGQRGTSATYLSTAQQTDDFLAWTGTKFDAGSAYNAFVSPYGLSNFDVIRVESCSTMNSLNGIKLTADSSITFDNIEIDGFSGGGTDPVPLNSTTALISIIDDGTGLTGTTIKRLSARNVDWRGVAGLNVHTLLFTSSGTLDECVLDCANYVDTPGASAGKQAGLLINPSSGGTIKRLVLSNLSTVQTVSSVPFIDVRNSVTLNDVSIVNGNFTLKGVDGSIIKTTANVVVNKLTLRDLQTRGTAATEGTLVDCLGRVDNVVFDNVECIEATNTIARMLRIQKANSNTNVLVNNCVVSSSSMFGDNGTNIGTSVINIHVNNSRLTLTAGNCICQFASAGATVVNVFSSGAYYSNRAKLFLTSGAVTYAFEEGGIVMRQGTITTGQLLALNATPQTIVPAPGASLAEILVGLELFYDYNSAAYAGIAAGEDLAVRYTNGSGAIVAECEATGFLDQTADAVRWVYPIAAAAAAPIGDVAPVANAALVLHMLIGEITTGNSPLLYRVFTKQINTAW